MAARSLRSLALVTSAVGTLVLTQGCVDDGVSLHVICPIAPTIDSDSCTYDPSAGLCTIEGLMNLGAAKQYSLNLRVESGLKARARDVPPQGEPNGLQVRSARIELRLPTGELIGFTADPLRDPPLPALPNPFEVSAAGYIAPGASGGVSIVAIPAAHRDRLLDLNSRPVYSQVVVSIKVKGKTNGLQEVESGEFVWPIRLDSQSNKSADKLCTKTAYCQGALGTDNFAYSCEDQ